MTELINTLNEVRGKRSSANPEVREEVPTNSGIVTLPWIPGLSPKLRKQFRKSGIKVVFKSGKNLKTILTAKNKTKLPEHSHPGVYKIPCKKHPKNPYVGETKLQIRSRNEQHHENARKQKWDQSGVVSHSRLCDGVQWSEIETVSVERNKFDRKVREALEIQYNKCGPGYGGMNLDEGGYVKTKFWMPFMAYLKQLNRKNERDDRSVGSTSTTTVLHPTVLHPTSYIEVITRPRDEDTQREL